MTTLSFRIRLCADAELGTGLGGELVNSFLPRDAMNMPHIPASHIKGLMRAALREIASPLRKRWAQHFTDEELGEHSWPHALLKRVFDPNGDDALAEPVPSLFVTDAKLPQEKFVRHGTVDRAAVAQLVSNVSRTKLTEYGMAEDMSLRTTEALATGSEFFGKLGLPFTAGTVEYLAAQLALLSINAVGGSRNRGGQCVVDLTGGPQAPRLSVLLQQLDQALKGRKFHTQSHGSQDLQSHLKSTHSPLTSINALATNSTLVELLFVADSPICIPERPDKTNLLISGFSIPASAVQGMLLNHINALAPKLASQLFEHPGFRCWPLQPCGDPADSEIQRITTALSQLHSGKFPKYSDKLSDLMKVFDLLPYSVRVSLSHRAAKFSTNSRDDFFEQAFGPRERAYDWKDKVQGAPLKAVDGVLLATENRIRLWSARSMRRHLTSHGVVEGSQRGSDGTGQNLFSVEAMAPLLWRGLVSLPENIVNGFLESIDSQPDFRIGKAKSVRGLGRLYGRRLPSDNVLFGNDSQEHTVLILQSPVAIPEQLHREMQRANQSAEDVLQRIAANWLSAHHLPSLASSPNCWASVSLLFGWNRHRRGLQSAVPVLQPGSVFVLESQADPALLQQAIMAGFRFETDNDDANHRQRGFGAVAVHPGMASEFYDPGTSEILKMHKSPLQLAMLEVLDWKSSPYLPSASQIRAVQQRLPNKTSALEHLKRQKDQRAVTRHTWEPIYDSVKKLIERAPDEAKHALDMLADIAASRAEGDER